MTDRERLDKLARMDELKEVKDLDLLQLHLKASVRSLVRTFSEESLREFIDEGACSGELRRIVASTIAWKRHLRLEKPTICKENTATLVRWFEDKSSKKVGYARRFLMLRHDGCGEADRRRILTAFILTGTAKDCEWAIDKLQDSWIPSMRDIVADLWQSQKGRTLARIIINYMPLTFVKAHLGELLNPEYCNEKLYREMCARLKGRKWFKPDFERLPFYDAYALGFISAEDCLMLTKTVLLCRLGSLIKNYPYHEDNQLSKKPASCGVDVDALHRGLMRAGAKDSLELYVTVMQFLSGDDNEPDNLSQWYMAYSHLGPEPEIPEEYAPFLTRELCYVDVLDYDLSGMFREDFGPDVQTQYGPYLFSPLNTDYSYSEPKVIEWDPKTSMRDYADWSPLLSVRPRLAEIIRDASSCVEGETLLITAYVKNGAAKEWFDNNLDDVKEEFMSFLAPFKSIMYVSWGSIALDSEDLPF